MSVVYQVILTLIGIAMIVNGSLMIYKALKKPKFGEGQTLHAINKLFSENDIMKKALLDIVCISHFDDFFNIPDDAEICDYVHVISVLKRDVASMQSKASNALDLIFEDVDDWKVE